jgi:predicted N-acetyltransferase YhbS
MPNERAMQPLQFEVAQSESDYQAAHALAASVFAGQTTMDHYSTYKGFLWETESGNVVENTVLAKNQKGQVVGLVRILPRTIYRASEPLAVAGISSVCLESAYRGQGLSAPLLASALDVCKKRGFDVALLFARRALDHYYSKFGFWGLSSYNKQTIQWDSRFGSASRIEFSQPDNNLLQVYRDAYDASYALSFGRVKRDLDDWIFLLRKLEYFPGMVFSTMLLDGNPIGYTVRSGTTVHELAYTHLPSVVDLMSGLQASDAFAPDSLTFEVPPQHQLLQDSAGFDVTSSARECRHGGHMIAVLDHIRAMALMETRLGSEYTRLAVPPFQDRSEELVTEWDGTDCHVSLARAPRANWTYQTTCELLGAASLTVPSREQDAILPFKISSVDEF